MHSQPKKILIAEDDTAISDVMTLILQDEGYEVTVLNVYDSIVDLLKSGKGNLLLLDIWLGGKNGTDICKQLKRNDQTKHIPIIIVSANTDIESLAKTAGADDTLQKPFDISELLGKVKQHLS